MGCGASALPPQGAAVPGPGPVPLPPPGREDAAFQAVCAGERYDVVKGWEGPALVVGVYDGDTYTVVFHHPRLHTWVKARCRAVGFNCPEVRGCGRRRGVAATEWVTAQFAQVHNRVWIRWHGRGKYGRHLGEVFLGASPRAPPLKDQVLAASHAVPAPAR